MLHPLAHIRIVYLWGTIVLHTASTCKNHNWGQFKSHAKLPISVALRWRPAPEQCCIKACAAKHARAQEFKGAPLHNTTHDQKHLRGLVLLCNPLHKYQRGHGAVKSFNSTCSPCKLEHCGHKHQHKGGHQWSFDASALTLTMIKHLMTFSFEYRVKSTEFGERFQRLLFRCYGCKSKRKDKRTKHHDKVACGSLRQ